MRLNTSIIARLVAAAGICAALQGCAVYEYIFGGPDPYDLPQIEMVKPAEPAQPAPAAVTPSHGGYPTPWMRQEMSDY